MITYEWRTVLETEESAELRVLLAEAAAADAEAGFSRLDLDDPVPDGTAHLLVWLLPDGRFGGEPEPSLAAYLRVEPADDGADASYVVRPAYRSRGITTTLLERLGPNAGSRTVRTWARGDHPAALRAATRFASYGIEVTRTRWRLLAPLRPDTDTAGEVRTVTTAEEREGAARLWPRPDGPPAGADVLVTGDAHAPGGAVWVEPDAGQEPGYGAMARIAAVSVRDRCDVAALGSLLRAALHRSRAAGARVAELAVDVREHALVREARLLGFRHDRTDVQYTLEPAAGAGHGNGAARSGATGH